MDADNKTDAEILDELENIYRRVAKEDVGKINSAGPDELFGTKPEKQQGKKSSSPVLYGILLLAVCLFAGIVLTVLIRPTGKPVSKPAVVETPAYRIPIAISPVSPKTDIKTSSKTETEKIAAAAQDKSEETTPAPAKKEEPENRKEIEPAIEKPYTIQISSIRNFEIAKDFLREASVSQPDVHWDRFNSKKYGVWYRVFIGHFASRAEALRYIKEKNIRNTYPGSFILPIPASPPKK